jgi:[ribosomal protein S5]-alanine N-acetyltransferase
MIKLVEYEKRHLSLLIELLNNPKVTNWLYEIPVPYTEKDAKSWLKFCRKNKNSLDNILYAIELDNELIGGIGLHKRMEHCYETGYWIGEQFWGKGYATESLSKVIDFAFNKLNIVRVQAYVFEGNVASEKVLEKCGFIQEGFLLKSHRTNNKYINSKLFAKVI